MIANLQPAKGSARIADLSYPRSEMHRTEMTLSITAGNSRQPIEQLVSGQRAMFAVFRRISAKVLWIDAIVPPTECKYDCLDEEFRTLFNLSFQIWNGAPIASECIEKAEFQPGHLITRYFPAVVQESKGLNNAPRLKPICSGLLTMNRCDCLHQLEQKLRLQIFKLGLGVPKGGARPANIK